MAIGNINAALDPGEFVKNRQNSYAALNGIQPQYQVVIDARDQGEAGFGQQEDGFPIIAELPESYSLGISSSWTSPLDNMSLNIPSAVAEPGGTLAAGAVKFNAVAAGINAGLGKAKPVLGAFGVSSKLKGALIQQYQSNSAVSVNLDLMFAAKTNTEADVRKKHMLLLKLNCPKQVGQVLTIPGPSIIRGLELGGTIITIRLGKYITLNNVIIKNVQSTVTTLCGDDGIPHHLKISIEVEGVYGCTTDKDIDEMFGVNNG